MDVIIREADERTGTPKIILRLPDQTLTAAQREQMYIQAVKGLDAAITDVCLKIEHISDKYDISFMDALNKIMETHVSWIDEEGEEK